MDHSETSGPLKGECILVTRPAHQSQALTSSLRELGAQVIELPLIRICPPDSWDEFDRAFKKLDDYSWLIFASANAVDSTWERADSLGVSGKIKDKKLACVGPSTAAALQSHGAEPTIVAKSSVAEGLVAEFPLPSILESNRILWPRTTIGRTVIKYALQGAGWQVDIVNSYKTEGPEDPKASAERLCTLLRSGMLTAITLTSSETVKQLHELILVSGDQNLDLKLFERIKLVVIGPETAKTCQEIFGRVDIQAKKFSTEGIVSALLE